MPSRKNGWRNTDCSSKWYWKWLVRGEQVDDERERKESDKGDGSSGVMSVPDEGGTGHWAWNCEEPKPKPSSP